MRLCRFRRGRDGLVITFSRGYSYFETPRVTFTLSVWIHCQPFLRCPCVDLVGHTYVGKSSIIAAMVTFLGIKKSVKQGSWYQDMTPTVSVFPHTTLGNVEIPLQQFVRPEQQRLTVGMLVDTP